MPVPQITVITDGEQPITDEMLHRMARQVDEMYAMFTRLLPMLPVLEAYQRGGVLGARTAAKRAKRWANGRPG